MESTPPAIPTGMATMRTAKSARFSLTPAERSTLISWSLYNLPSPMTTATYSAIGISTSRAIAVFNSMNLSMAKRPSDSDAALAKKRALLKLENSVARITATTVNGISNSRVIYRSIIFKDYPPPRLDGIAFGIGNRSGESFTPA